MNKKIYEVDIARGIAIIGVLLIHGTSEAVTDLPKGSFTQLIYLAINKLANFSVPTFILLSGLVLCYRYRNDWSGEQSIIFYKKRLKFIFIPYLIWSSFYYYFKHRVSFGLDSTFSFSQFIHQLLFGTTEYHLYFVILILQYYCIFPLIFHLIKQHRRSNIIITTSLLIPILVQVLNKHYMWTSDMSSYFTTYLDAFCIGGYIGYHYETVKKRFKNYRYLTFILMIIFLTSHITYSGFYYKGFVVNPIISQLIVHCYSVIAAIWIIMTGGYYLNSNPFSRVSAKILSLFGKLSLGIYFIHPVFLSMYRSKINAPISSIMYHVNTIIGILLIVIVPIVLLYFSKKYKYSWIVLGK